MALEKKECPCGQLSYDCRTFLNYYFLNLCTKESLRAENCPAALQPCGELHAS